MKNDVENAPQRTLLCERSWVYALLMIVGGFYGGYTYCVRGGIFCNAQTANFVLMSMALGRAQWGQAFYYIIPMSAYLMGAVVSEWLPKSVRRLHIRWDTLLLMIEVGAVILIGILPETVPHQIAQVSINIICSMRYNTFRKTKGIDMATTFCTNHVRQSGIAIVQVLRHPENDFGFRKLRAHFSMLGMFIVGGVAATILSDRFTGKAIWAVLPLLVFLLLRMLYADLKTEKDLLMQVPSGH